jgi:hypothetical protein
MNKLPDAPSMIPASTTANPTPGAGAPFREGDEVVLAEGTYQGTPGVFLKLSADPNWADITERNGDIRSHPVAWLAHYGAGLPSFPAHLAK